MSDLEKLQKQIVAFRDARNWQQFHNPKDMALSLVLEAAEVLEHFQWKSADEMDAHLDGPGKAEVAEELADVLYWVLLMAHDFDIDLPAAVADKMKKNSAKYPIAKSRGNHRKYTEL